MRIDRIEESQALDDIIALRREVFVEEQHIDSSLELDGKDGEAIHFLATDEGMAIGCARLRIDDFIRFERICVRKSHRGHGVGSQILEAMMEYARARWPHKQGLMEAQSRAIPFYEQKGWVAAGEEYLKAGIPHRRMVL